MKYKFTRNLGLKLLSLAVAFLIWLLVANINNPVTSQLYKDVKVKTINQESVTDIDKVFDVIEGDTVTLKVTERTRVLQSLKKDDFEVIADLEAMNEMNAIPLYVTCDNLMVTWDEIEIYPSTMKVQLEQKKQSEFVISVSTSGQVAKGYEVGTTEVLQGKTVQIAGPESMLKKIGRVVAAVSVNNLQEDQVLQAALTVYDKNDEQFTPSEMERIEIKNSSGVLISDNKVDVRVTLWEVMNDIPVQVETVGTPAEGYRITKISTVPVTVNLVGTPEALAEINGKIVLKAPVSVEGASETITQDLDITETLADDAELRLVEGAEPTVTVTVQIEKIGDRTMEIPLTSLELLNRPKDMTLTFSPPDAIPIRIHSDDESVYSIKTEDITGTIDLSQCEKAGSYEIPVELKLPDGYELVSEVTIVVTSENSTSQNGTGTNTEE
ncbi:MAG: CdaR family protein [Lachnospiraceae bacterium]|nr:CdaR family protein [Lachnospiraceae bacterium]